MLQKVLSFGGFVGIQDNLSKPGSTFFFEIPFLDMNGFDESKLDEIIKDFKQSIPAGLVNERGISYPPPSDLSSIEFVDKSIASSRKEKNVESKFNPRTHKGMVLVTDDSPSIRKYWCVKLDKLKYYAIECEDGLPALDKMKEYLYAFVIIDMMMPGLDGVSTTKRIRQHEKEVGKAAEFKQIIALSSGGVDEELESAAFAAGVNVVGKKPCDPDVFIRNLGQLFEAREQGKQQEEKKQVAE